MSTFENLHFKAFYRTGESDLVSDFYLPALSAAAYYDRSSGYFTASALPILAKGLHVFLAQQGKIRMVISPQLSIADQKAINEGIERRKIEELSQDKLLEILQEAEKEEASSVRLLAALVASGRLEFRVAIPTSEYGEGIYHEKFGIFGDDEGDWVAFTGSPNETAGGLLRNFESIAVFQRSVGYEVERIRELHDRFQSLWENNTRGAIVFDFPTAVRNRLLENKPNDIRSFIQQLSHKHSDGLRAYQLEAIRKWESAGFRGIWSMATGTGKTITALRAISARIQTKGIVVIVVPSQDLVDQWALVIERQQIPATVVRCYSENHHWRKLAINAVLQRHLPITERRPGYLITTASTAITDDFANVIRSIPQDELLLVGDEVHRLGARSWQKIFSYSAGLGRLGLSATPFRQWDTQGTNTIFDYFGGIIFEYGLAEAMRDGWLSPYLYFPKLVGMEPEERAEYLELSNKISKLLLTLAKRYGLQTPDLQQVLRLAREDGDPQLELLLYARADVIKGISGKLHILRQLASEQTISSCMVYCNDESQVEDSLAILTTNDRRAVGFTSSRLAGDDRPTVLRDFATGIYEFIVAIRCLDEGVDIPDARYALIMASSKTEREWIQRRGRLLRIAPGKDHATIYDCIVVPSRVDEDGNLLDAITSVEMSILHRELARAREFAKSASNASSAILYLETLRNEAQRAVSNKKEPEPS
jgi:superfamily II DNA or RNA helicase